MNKVIFLKNLFSVIILGVFLSTFLHASSERLSDDFTAETSFLDRVRGIKATLATPDAFSPELVTFAQEIVEKVGGTIPAEGEKRQIFTMIQGYAEKEISQQTLSLNRLNYLVFQLAVAMNPLVKSPYDIFEDLQKFLESGLWKQSYDEAITVVKAVPAAAEPKEQKRFDTLIMTIFRPCDWGQWVFPLVSDNPLYGIATYNRAFAEGISFTGLPLRPENCEVHTGLITPGDYVLFLYHDLLHNATLTPFMNPVLNAQHMTAMQQMVRHLILQIDQLPVAEQGDAHVTLFWLCHELVSDKINHPESAYDLSKHSLRYVFEGVMDHAGDYVDKTISVLLQDRATLYKKIWDTGMTAFINQQVDGVLDVDFTVMNEDGALSVVEVLNLEAAVAMTIPNASGQFFLVTSKGRMTDTVNVFTSNIFKSFPIQRAFVWSIVDLMVLRSLP